MSVVDFNNFIYEHFLEIKIVKKLLIFNIILFKQIKIWFRLIKPIFHWYIL